MKLWPSIPDPTPDATQQMGVLQTMKNVIEMITGQRGGAPAPMVRLYKTFTAPGAVGSPIIRQQLRDGDIWVNLTSGGVANYWDIASNSWKLIGRFSNRYTNFTNATVFNNTTTSFEMAGFGSLFTLTPGSAGRVRVKLTAKVQQVAAGGSGSCYINYGTGTAPAANAAETGIRTTTTAAVAYDASGNLIITSHIEVEIVGLTIGTAYWFDLAAAATVTGTMSITPIAVIIEEF